MIKFSVTIPAYKAKFLKNAIDSVLSQTYDSFELVIINDASPEDLSSIVSQYSDPRILYYVNEKNCGALNVVDNWNNCLNRCKGEYMICMGDDDCLMPNCLEEYARLIEKYPKIGVLHGWTEIINENGEFVNITEPRPEYESLYSMIWNRWDNRALQFIGDWCFEVDWLRKNGGFFKLPLAWGSDDISAIIGAQKNGVVNTQCLCFQYRMNSQNISSTGNVESKLEAVKLERQWFDKFLKRKPVDPIDEKYWLCLNLLNKTRWDKKFSLNYYGDIRKNPMRLGKWIRKRHIYGYSIKSIFFALYLAIKGN